MKKFVQKDNVGLQFQGGSLGEVSTVSKPASLPILAAQPRLGSIGDSFWFKNSGNHIDTENFHLSNFLLQNQFNGVISFNTNARMVTITSEVNLA